MFRRFILVCLLVTAAAFASPALAQAADYSYSSNLRWWVHNSLEQASIDQGSGTKHVPREIYVRCYTSKWAFEKGIYLRGGGYADAKRTIAYYAGGATINMRAGTCALATDFVAGHVTQDSAGASKTLLHEALHRQGFEDERMTEAFAITSMYQAGQLVDYNRRLGRGAAEDDATWKASDSAGARALVLSWHQSHRYIAQSYRSSWPAIKKLYGETSWADWLSY
jgi:hypothetical protein